MKDYLHTLPVELWYKIMSESTFFGYPYTIDTEISLSYINVCFKDGVIRAQHDRLQHLTICKELQVVTEPLLFTEVYLEGKSMYDAFMAKASTIGRAGRLCGEHTRSLLISPAVDDKPARVSIRNVFSTCPNLRHFDVSRYEELEAKEWEGPWDSPLISLAWGLNSFRWDHLYQLSTRCLNLTRLQLGYFDAHGSTETQITFPNVKLLSLNGLALEVEELTELNFPRLEVLYAEPRESRHLDNFLARYGSQLKRAEITPVHAPIRFPIRFFETCRVLEELRFDAVMMRPVLVNREPEIEPHTRLSILMPVIGSVGGAGADGYMKAIRRHGRFFTRERFPGLKLVSFDISYDSTEEWQKFVDAVAKVFPDVDLEAG